MKLISNIQPISPAPVQPVQAPVLEHTGKADPVQEYQVAFVADSPEQIAWAFPLTWKLADLPRPDLHMNDQVRQWCNYSQAFKNWLYTCLSVFVGIGQSEISIPIPDQFIDDLDRKALTLERIGNEIRILI